MATILGTEIADFLDRSLHVEHTFGSLFLCAWPMLTLRLWNKKFKSVSVCLIFEKNKEIYDWIGTLFSYSLGRAFVDYLSDVFGWGDLNEAILTDGIIVMVLLLHDTTKINHIIKQLKLFFKFTTFHRPTPAILHHS